MALRVNGVSAAVRSRRGGGQPLLTWLILTSFLSGCAVAPQQQGTASLGQGSPRDLEPTRLRIGQKDYDPCAEANRQSEAFAGAIAGGIGGALVGALSGALIAKLSKSDAQQGARRGALVGLGLGVIAGYSNGVDSFRRQCDLYKVARARNANAAFVSFTTGNETTGEVVITPDQGHFFNNSDQLTPAGITYFTDLARQYTSQVQIASYEQTVRASSARKPDLGELKTYSASPEVRTKLDARWRAYRIVVTGHTDDQRDASVAQNLSERRAQNVASIFRSTGVPESSLLYQGAGASFPVADNRTDVGRQKNNRVEVVVLYDEKTLNEYADARTPNYEYFSEKSTMPVEQPVKQTATVAEAKRPMTKIVPAKPAATAAATTRPTTTVQSPVPNTTAKTVAAAQPALPLVEPGIDLGGILATSYVSTLTTRLGKIRPPSDGLMIDTLASFVGIGTAYATSNRVIESCDADDAQRYRPGQIKKLSDGTVVAKNRAPISVTDSYLFSTVRAVFHSQAGDHYVEVKNVTAKKSGELAEDPQFNLYKNFRTKTDAEKRATSTPDVSMTPTVYSLLGEGGLLIRQFYPRGNSVVCMDLVIPNDRTVRSAPDTALVYTQAGARKIANLTMER